MYYLDDFSFGSKKPIKVVRSRLIFVLEWNLFVRLHGTECEGRKAGAVHVSRDSLCFTSTRNL